MERRGQSGAHLDYEIIFRKVHLDYSYWTIHEAVERFHGKTWYNELSVSQELTLQHSMKEMKGPMIPETLASSVLKFGVRPKFSARSSKFLKHQ